MIIIKGADLYSPPTKDLPCGGVLYRTGKRIKSRIANNHEVADREKRNILIGEVGEAAAMADFVARGFDVTFLSWQEFNDKRINETATDLIVRKGDLIQRIQVKASENGNRTIRTYNMLDYERSNITTIMFIAVRELEDLNGERYFECEITSQLAPRHIRMMTCWQRRDVGWQHVDNLEFIKEWQLKSARKGARRLLTPDDVWDLTC